MVFEGKAVALRALLEATDHSQGQQPDVYGGKAFKSGQAVVPVQLWAKFTLKAGRVYTSCSRADYQTRPTWTVGGLCSSEHVHTYIVSSLED